MSESHASGVTRLLMAAENGDRAAVNQLWEQVYTELGRLAHIQIGQEGARGAWQTTSLVNETYMRLIGREQVTWENRRHFFGAAAQAMRRLRIDRAREKHRIKRGGGKPVEPLLEDPVDDGPDQTDVLAIDQALKKMEATDPRRAEVVMLRYFAGLSVDDTALALSVSARTVDNDWRFAKAWLHRALSGESSAEEPHDG